MSAAEERRAKPIRIMLFNDRPDCILFYVQDGERLEIPPIPAPFYKAPTASLLGQAGVKFRITEASATGRWTEAIVLMRKSDKAERGQLQRQREASMAALERSGGPLAQSRAEALAKKHVIDDQIRELKSWIGRAKAAAFTRGVYEDAATFRKKEKELAELKQESQALQTALGDLKKKEKAENIAASNEELQAFKRAAYRVLSSEMFDEVLAAMADDMDAEDSRSDATQSSSEVQG